MPQIRQNPVTKEWVIIATERAKRPEDFNDRLEEPERKLPEYEPNCPFCPGNEDKTPAQVFALPQEGEWQVRVIPNKFAALNRDEKLDQHYEGLRWSVNGAGIHDVIIETRKHNLTTALMSTEQMRMIIEAYRIRFDQITKDKRVQMVVLFKNHGPSAGTSLIHSHSQIIGVPIVPGDILQRIITASRHYQETGKCLFCQNMEDEMRDGSRIVMETKHFVAFIPYAALSPFHTWLFPKRHMARFTEITDEEADDLAVVMKTLLGKFYYGLKNPDFNYVIRSAPATLKRPEHFHWYITFIPRVTKTAGFELGSGMFVNPSLPEKSAEFLRNVQIK